MSTSIDRAAEVLWLHEPHLSGSECDDQARELAQALADAGLLAPAPTVIRTVEELAALDPKAVVLLSTGLVTHAAGARVFVNVQALLPAVVVSPAAQVRAARKALEEA